MLIVKKVTAETPGIWTKRTLWGAEIDVQIRPMGADVYEQIRKRHISGVEWTTDQKTGRKEKKDIINEAAFLDDLIDSLIQDFRNIGDSADEPWPADIVHKRKLADLPVDRGEEPVFDWILSTARRYSFDVAEDTAERQKN
jgi:hypothetical protein